MTETAVQSAEPAVEAPEAAQAPKHSETLLEIVKQLAHETAEEIVDALRHIESAAATLASKAL